MKKRNAKFWVWHNSGWVRLKLRPGQEIAVESRGFTDEGFKEEYNTYCYDPHEDCIWSKYTSHERDCDGRHSHYSDCVCLVSELELLPASEWWKKPALTVAEGRYLFADDWEYNYPNPARPNWEKVSSHQRDYYAEAMGY